MLSLSPLFSILLLCLGFVLFCKSIPLQGLDVTGGCNDASDINILKKDNNTFHTSVSDCASPCFGYATCTAKCLVKKLGLSSACALCFGKDVACTADECVSSGCLTSPNSEECCACSIKQCGPSVVTCSGLQPNQLPRCGSSTYY